MQSILLIIGALLSIISLSLSIYLTYLQITREKKKQKSESQDISLEENDPSRASKKQKDTKLKAFAVKFSPPIFLITIAILGILYFQSYVEVEDLQSKIELYETQNSSKNNIRKVLTIYLSELKDYISDYELIINADGDILDRRKLLNLQSELDSQIKKLNKVKVDSNIFYQAWYYNINSYYHILFTSCIYFNRSCNEAISWSNKSEEQISLFGTVLDSIQLIDTSVNSDLLPSIHWIESEDYLDLKDYYSSWTIAIKIICQDESVNQNLKQIFNNQLNGLSSDFIEKYPIRDNYFINNANELISQ